MSRGGKFSPLQEHDSAPLSEDSGWAYSEQRHVPVSYIYIRITSNNLGIYWRDCRLHKLSHKSLSQMPKMHAVPPPPHTTRGSMSKENPVFTDYCQSISFFFQFLWNKWSFVLLTRPLLPGPEVGLVQVRGRKHRFGQSHRKSSCGETHPKAITGSQFNRMPPFLFIGKKTFLGFSSNWKGYVNSFQRLPLPCFPFSYFLWPVLLLWKTRSI